MSELIISVSGLRGIVGETLVPEVAIRYAAAFATGLERGTVIVTRDGRATGAMIADAVCSAVAAGGRNIINAGVTATPTTGVLVRDLNAVGGLQISASHNPAAYNGIKLFGSDGRVVTAEAGEKVLQRFQANDFSWVGHDRIGHAEPIDDTTSRHLKLVLDTVNVSRIREKKFHVLLDSNHGAGSILGRQLLDELGCTMTLLGATPDGQFAHTPEPTADHLKGVSTTVAQQEAVVGFCQDPDADRLALIDENGRYIGEEFTLAICLAHVLESHTGPVVTNCSTSRMSQDLAEKHGVALHRSKVGEANVTTLMEEVGAVFGGEGNGGPIDPRVGYVRDSFVGMALVLDALAARDMPLSALADELPQYAIHKTKVPLGREQVDAAITALKNHFGDAKPNEMDGLRLDWPDKWLLVRASNTEPIVRIIAEAPSLVVAKSICDQATKVINS